jgi:Fur family ferric uptake transcriptional regulator
MRKPHSDSPSSAIESAIRATGARVTPARVRILGLLQSAHRPLSHRDIEALLSRDAFPEMDRVTLYRTLDWLASSSLARKATDARGVFCFTAINTNVEHSEYIHFRCTGYGGVFCLDMRPPPPPKLPEGFWLTGVDVDISGECANCGNNHSRSGGRPLGMSAL